MLAFVKSRRVKGLQKDLTEGFGTVQVPSALGPYGSPACTYTHMHRQNSSNNGGSRGVSMKGTRKSASDLTI